MIRVKNQVRLGIDFGNTIVKFVRKDDQPESEWVEIDGATETIRRLVMKDEAFNQQDRTLRRYLKPELLIIDDFGLKQLPKNSGEHLFEVIMRRNENRSTIMTSNRPLEEWGSFWVTCPRLARS